MICKRCGKCCLTLVDKDFWLQSPLFFVPPHLNHKKILCGVDKRFFAKIDNAKKLITSEREKYSPNKTGCEMLVFENGIAVCLIEKLFGKEFKPEICLLYEDCSKIGV